jgi:hypothetical protein
MGMFLTGVIAAEDENSIPGPSFKDVLSLQSIEGA